MIQTGAFPARPAGLWESLWKLLRMRLLLTWSNFRRAKPRQKIFQAIFLLVLVAIAAGGFVFSRMLIQFLSSPALAAQIDLTGLFKALPGSVLTLAFLFNLLTNFGVLLQSLYLSRDMDFLIAAPLPMRAVFLSKMILAVLPGFGLFCLVALPLLFGLGAASDFKFIYYPLAVILLSALALAASGSASILVMAVVRVIPPRRVAEVLGFIGAILSILISQSGNLLGSMGVDGEQLSGAISRFRALTPVWSPFTWASRGLVDLGNGTWLSGVGLTLLTLLAAGGLFALTLLASEQLYYTGWAGLRASAQKGKVRARRKPAGQLYQRLPVRLAAPLAGIVRKDFLLLRRDLRNLSQLITPMILGVVYSAMLVRNNGAVPAGRGEAPDWFMYLMKNAIVYGNIGVSLFVSWSLISRLASMGFGQEGRSYWLLKTAPLKSWQLLLAKYLVALLPSLAIGWLFILAISLLQRASPMVLLFGILVVGLDIAGLAGLNLAFGVIGAKFDWEDPRYMVRGGVGCVAALAGLAYLVVSLSFFFGPALLASALGWPEMIGQGIGLALGSLVCLACAILPPWLVRQRLEQLGEGV